MDIYSLTTVDLTRYPSFMDTNETMKFMESELGRAQVDLIREEVPEKLTDEQMMGALWDVQSAQIALSIEPVVDEVVLSEYNFAERACDNVVGAFNTAVEGVVEFGKDIMHTDEPLGDGLLNGAVEGIQNRNDQIEQMLNEPGM